MVASGGDGSLEQSLRGSICRCYDIKKDVVRYHD